MSWTGCRTALASRLSGVSGVNNVYEFRRHNNDGFANAEFKALFTTVEGQKRKLDGWFIENKGLAQEQCPDSDSKVKRTHSVEIFGFQSLVDADASANTWVTLIESVLSDLNTVPRDLGGACYTHGLAQSVIDTEIFYGHLSHTVVITFEVEEII